MQIVNICETVTVLRLYSFQTSAECQHQMPFFMIRRLLPEPSWNSLQSFPDLLPRWREGIYRHTRLHTVSRSHKASAKVKTSRINSAPQRFNMEPLSSNDTREPKVVASYFCLWVENTTHIFTKHIIATIGRWSGHSGRDPW